MTRGSTGLVNVTDPPNTGYLKLKKESMNPDITEKNSAYSLAGATYGVYGSRADAQKDANRMAVLTTDENGNTETLELKSGVSGITYYVKELTPSPGFLLCDGRDGSDNGIHAVTVTTNHTSVVSCKEPLATADFPLELQKYDGDTGLAKPQEQQVWKVRFLLWNIGTITMVILPERRMPYGTTERMKMDIFP